MDKEFDELRGKAAIAAMSALLPSYVAPLPEYLEKKGISAEEYLAKQCVKFADALVNELNDNDKE